MFVENPSTRVPPTIPPSTMVVFRWNRRIPGSKACGSSQPGAAAECSKNSTSGRGASRSAAGSAPSMPALMNCATSRAPRPASAATAASATGSPTTVCAT